MNVPRSILKYVAEPIATAIRVILCALVLIWGAVPVWADAADNGAVMVAQNDLPNQPLEVLMQYVTIPSRRPEPLSETAAAAYVLTQDDIRRSGATSIPEALRTVPGLDVARLDSHTWAISSRGFNDVFANKLLVMIDGRTVYTPLFSGVFWDVQDTVLEDIDHIEVVRGPGATLWGANAVNGVINVVTKSAKDSQGLLVSGGGGTEERDFGTVRYGLKLDDGVYLKAYAKWFDRDSSVFANGADSFDEWSMVRGGFRLDVEKDKNNTFTLQGDAYSGQQNEAYFVPTLLPPFATTDKSIDNVSGANVLGRWRHDFGTDSQLTAQAYYDRTVRNNPVLSEKRDTVDIDLQHVFKAGDRNEITYGGGFRSTSRDVGNSLNATVLPVRKTYDLFSAFVQDEISVVPERFKAIIGSKFEHNDFTGFEVQPSVRGIYTPSPKQAIWAAISRAVRTPSEAENDITLNTAHYGLPPVVPFGGRLFPTVALFGNPNLLSESLMAYEVGYRIQPAARLSLDFTAFYNDYSRIRSLDPLPSAPGLPPFVHPFIAANKLEGYSYGAELAATFQAVPEKLRLRSGYTFLRVHLRPDGGGTDVASAQMIEGSSPEHQFFVQSSFNLPFHLQFDTTLRCVDRLNGPGIPSYVEMDSRLAWLPRTNLEFAIVGQNLLHEHHAEFAPTFIGSQSAQIERGVYGKVTFRY